MDGTDSWLDSPLVLKIVSVIIAAIIWMYVSYSPNIGKMEKIMEVKLQTVNAPKDMVVKYTPAVVEINVMGFREDITSVSSKGVYAYIDLKGLSSGTYRVPVEVEVPAGVHVEKVEPAKVSVKLMAVKRRSLDVKVSVIGFPPDGYVADQPIVTPAQVEVEGSEEVLHRAKFAVVSVDMSGLKSSIRKREPVRVVDDSGNEIRGIKVIPSNVEVAVNVREGWPQKVVKVRAALRGRLSNMWTLKHIDVKPSSVVIEGPRLSLSKVKEVMVFVPANHLNKEVNVLTLPIKLPLKEVKVIEKQSITVTVVLSEKVIEKRFEIPVIIRGKSVFKKWKVSPTSVEVLVRGKYSVIKSVRPEAYVDISNVVSKKKKLRVSVKVPEGMNVVNIRPEDVTVEVVE